MNWMRFPGSRLDTTDNKLRIIYLPTCTPGEQEPSRSCQGT